MSDPQRITCASATAEVKAGGIIAVHLDLHGVENPLAAPQLTASMRGCKAQHPVDMSTGRVIVTLPPLRRGTSDVLVLRAPGGQFVGCPKLVLAA